jgi:LEA14-like dessication related protein
MSAQTRAFLGSLAACLLLLSGCASLQKRDPLRVDVAGVEPLKGQGFEMRMTVKLRVQNPNDAPVEYRGVSLQMDVEGKTLATGVSDVNGSVPRFGEAVIEVPVTMGGLNMVKQAMGLMKSMGTDKIKYELKGKLGSNRFATQGEFEMPRGAETASD